VIQESYSATNIIENSVEMLLNAAKRHKVMDLYLQIWDKLRQDEKPSHIAAKVIYEYLKNDEDNRSK
jgi:hypothetical protein